MTQTDYIFAMGGELVHGIEELSLVGDPGLRGRETAVQGQPKSLQAQAGSPAHVLSPPCPSLPGPALHPVP